MHVHVFLFCDQTDTLHVVLSLGPPTSWLSLLTQANSEPWYFFSASYVGDGEGNTGIISIIISHPA